MVHRIGKYSFDEVTFDEAYTRLEDALLADKIRLVEWVPLVGFDATTDVPQVQLPDDVVLQRMTNNQISDAIGHHAVPAEFAGGPNSVTVSRLDQWALTRERAFPICQADPGTLTGDEIPQTPSFPALEAALIAALRIVSGGSVAATRALRARHDDDFLMADGPTVSLSMVPTTVRERPTVLLGNDLEQLHQVIGWLRDPTVVNNRALQTAIRRLVVAGSQHLAGDRLIDLMICAEVLFLKTGQTARTRRAKGKPIAEGAATLLTHDAALSASHSQIYAFMDEAYQRRNDETHGDDPEEGNLLRLDGGPATGASEVADDLEKVLRRATYVIIQQAVAPASRMMG